MSDGLLLELVTRLTDRDRRIILALDEHRVLTTGQIHRLWFTSLRHTQRRLATLQSLGVLTGIRPRAEQGSAPTHWILGSAGVTLIAAHYDEPVRKAVLRRERALHAVLGPHREHTVGTNEFFVRLHTAPGHLSAWWSSTCCARTWGDMIQPDGYGRYKDENRAVGLWLEYDRGTETVAQVAGKIGGYVEAVRTIRGTPPWVCITVPGPRRERGIQEALGTPDIAIATAVHHESASPADAIWQPVGTPERLRLIDLADQPRPGEPMATQPASVAT